MPVIENSGFVAVYESDELGITVIGPNSPAFFEEATPITFNGNNVDLAGFTLVAVEPNESGFGAVLQDASGNFFYWILDSNAAITSSGSLTDAQVANSEFYFGQDLNGDGNIGPFTAAPFIIDSIGTGLVADASGFYIADPSTGVIGNLVQLTFNGAPILPASDGTYEGFALITVESNDSGYGVILQNATTGEFAFWQVDASGAIVAGGSLTDTQVATSEFYFGDDLDRNGIPGPFTAVPTVVDTTNVFLGGDTSGFYIYDPAVGINGNLLQLTFNGAAIVPAADGTYEGFNVIAAESNDSGYGVILQNAATGEFAFWQVDASGAIVSGGSLTDTQVATSELYFGQDLDGNGIPGPFTAAPTVVDTTNVILGGDTSGFYIYDPAVGVNGNLLQLTFNGAVIVPAADGTYEGFNVIAAESNDSGYGVILQNDTTGDFAFWQVDASGAIVAGGSLTDAQVGASEFYFGQDLDGNGITGPFTAPPIVVEAVGTAGLVFDASGFYIANPAEGVNGNLLAITLGGVPVTPSSISGFDVLEVETNSDGYGAILQDASGNFFFWLMDPAGAITGSGSLTLGGALAAEGIYGQDFDGDGFISIGGTSVGDLLVGTTGTDVIVGLEGADELAGGLGVDLFRYTSLSEAGDVILDFGQAGGDIDGLRIDELLVSAGIDPANETAVNELLTFTASGSDTVVSIDVDGAAGAGAPVTLATLIGTGPATSAFTYVFASGIGVVTAIP